MDMVLELLLATGTMLIVYYQFQDWGLEPFFFLN